MPLDLLPSQLLQLRFPVCMFVLYISRAWKRHFIKTYSGDLTRDSNNRSHFQTFIICSVRFLGCPLNPNRPLFFVLINFGRLSGDVPLSYFPRKIFSSRRFKRSTEEGDTTLSITKNPFFLKDSVSSVLDSILTFKDEDLDSFISRRSIVV